MPGESAEYSVQRANNTGSGSRRAVLLYPPRSLIHIEMPLIPALRPAVSTNGLPTVLTAGLNAGMSGISMWMSDLGGYNKTARRDPDPVLFARWTEYSALSPGMEVMSSYNFGPWDYGDEGLRIFRNYSVLHMSLFPYRYAAA